MAVLDGPGLVLLRPLQTANAHFQLSEPARTEDFATWLETPGERERRRAEKEQAKLAMQTQLVGDIYMSKRGKNA